MLSHTLIPRGNRLFTLMTIYPFSPVSHSRQFTARSGKSGGCNAVLKVYSEYSEVENALANAHPSCGSVDGSSLGTDDDSESIIVGDINIIVGVHGLRSSLCELWLSHVRSRTV
jgi:hypothetical protein